MKWQVDWAKELLIGWLIVGLPFLMELILTWWLINPTISFSSFFYNMFQRQIQYRPFFAVLLLFFSFMAILLALHAVLIGQEPYFEQKLSLRDVKVWGRTSLILQLALIVIWIVVYFDYDVSWYEALFGAITLVYPFFMVGLIPLGIIPNQSHGRSARSGLFLYAGESLKKANHHLRQGSDEAGQFVERSRETIHYLAPTAATDLPGTVMVMDYGVWSGAAGRLTISARRGRAGVMLTN
jgi:hypothetical protein